MLLVVLVLVEEEYFMTLDLLYRGVDLLKLYKMTNLKDGQEMSTHWLVQVQQ
jgi:hypothetical protein